MTDLPEEQVLVKISYCKKCNGNIATAILHKMDAKSIAAFDREIKKYDLNVKIITLLQYRKEPPIWCKC